MKEETVNLKRGKAEALVLFELLSRELGRPKYGQLAEVSTSDAELWALDGLLGALESTLPEPFAANYLELVAEAASCLVEWRGKLSPTTLKRPFRPLLKPFG
ncbi:hypothetical protein [Sinorhizobium psoraleae]|uniref:Uncharacterized protein n=1 Tax=Sinorhizobium psoraleae TaxID=520838 RepID=A0ABT4KA82_9HYPH|nr:hypothetical protein [Sinorhizobium psoraleae]MCZ4088868.1 hypothetical protein [Sinorhizobium psoraleae]